VIIDTGLADAAFRPDFLDQPNAVMAAAGGTFDVPDRNNDQWLDPVAGHGTFIAAIIKRIAPGCTIEVRRVIEPQGEASESSVVDAIKEVANQNDRPAFLNLSFGGYVWKEARMLSDAILLAQQRGIVVVASAGNDSTCRPAYPAAIPGVVSVGAIGPGGPAWFSNYGDWVRACAPGVDVVSSFFSSFDGLEVASGGIDIDRFQSWATWSGTSFAAPAVVGALAREMLVSQCTPTQAVARLIDAPGLGRIPGLGTIVNV
jgi:subtilisin family serine protease